MEALHRLDKHVEQLIQATKNAKTFDDTNFVILGDHYQINVNKMIHLNTLFAKKGWLKANNDQTFDKDFTVSAKTCDGSSYIYTRDFDQLEELKQLVENVEGVQNVYTSAQATKRGADPKCSLMVEAKAGYYFTDESSRPAVVERVDPKTLGTTDRYHGVHGYDPDKEDYQTTIVFNGPAIKEGITVEKANLVDEAPTFAKLLGLKFDSEIAGSCIEDVFKD